MVRQVTEQASSHLLPAYGIGRENWDAPAHLAIGQLRMHELFPTVALEPGEQVQVLPGSGNGLPVADLDFADPLRPGEALGGVDFLNRRLFNDALIVIDASGLRHESYRNGMRPDDRHVIHSCSKSLCAMLVAIAVEAGRMQRENCITDYVPQLADIPAWQGVSLQQVLDMQAGIEYSEDYADPRAHYWCYARSAGYYPPLPGEQVLGIEAWIVQNLHTRAADPGTAFAYNSCLTNVLGMALEHVYQQGLAQVFETHLYSRIGAEREAWFNTDRYGFPITEGQLNLSLRDFARLALLLLHEGRNLAGEQVIPASFIQRITDPDANARQLYAAAATESLFPRGQYKEQYWVTDPGAQQFTMLGIHGQFAWLDLERQQLIAGFGSFPVQDGKLMMATLRTLWHTISDAL